MRRITWLAIALLLVTSACRRSVSSNRAATNTLTAQTSTEPGIYPQEDVAEAIHEYMGHSDVLAYEFRGMWLECWLEYQIDGEPVKKSNTRDVTPTDFIGSQHDVSSSKPITGTITCFGDEHHTMSLLVRATYSHSDTEKSFTGGSYPAKITVPDTDTKFASSRGIIDAGWTDPISLPTEVGEEFTLQSWGWVEFDDVSGEPITREVKVWLKARQLTGDEASKE